MGSEISVALLYRQSSSMFAEDKEYLEETESLENDKQHKEKLGSATIQASYQVSQLQSCDRGDGEL